MGCRGTVNTMNKRNTPYMNDDRASIGIGAMIVFIALILVAAVASTIIIKTAEELQQRAEATGDDTRDEISGKVTIISAHIDTVAAGPPQTVTQVVVIAQMSAGSDSVIADDIAWLVICDGGASAGFDTNDIVTGGSTTLANAGTATQIATGTTINSGDTFTFDMGLANCAPQVNTEIEVRIIIDGGGETYAQMSATDMAEGSPLV